MDEVRKKAEQRDGYVDERLENLRGWSAHPLLPGETESIAPVDEIEMVYPGERSFVGAPLAALNADETIVRSLDAANNSMRETERA